MQLFAREPIFDKSQNIFAYQFIYRNGINGSFPMELASSTIEEDDTQGLNIDDLLQVKHTVINVLPDLTEEFSETFSSEGILIEFSELAVAPSKLMLEQIAKMKQLGFGFIIRESQLEWESLIPFCDFVKVSLKHNPVEFIEKIINMLSGSNIKIIATDIHTQFQFEQCIKLDVDYIQGFFFLDSKKKDEQNLPTSKLAYLQLMTEIAKPDLDVNLLEDIFKKDPTLSYLLIKFINNPLVNKSHKITSIRHAINYLGELMIRRFVAIISLAGLNSDQPQELLNLSLSRAKFCEMVDAEMYGESDAMSAFLVGLFSLIDIILKRDMRKLLEKIELDDSILVALLKGEGNYASILSVSKAIEAGNWSKLYTVAGEINVEKEHLFDLHRQAVRWQYDMTDAISPLFPVVKP